MEIFDVHTHCFPDFLAQKAIEDLSKLSGPYTPHYDGTVSGLLKSMEQNGISKSFILNIATKPSQTKSIIKWSNEIKSDKIIPLGSVHPDSVDWEQEILDIKKSGLPGIKLHPMYQNFKIDEKRLYPIYECIKANNLFIIFHSGYDVAYPGDDSASVSRIVKLLNNISGLTIILSHFGAWQEWENVLEYIAGKDVFLETSFINEINEDIKYKILSKHDSNRILFGTDSPWLSQKQQLNEILNLKISNGYKEKILYKNVLNFFKMK